MYESCTFRFLSSSRLVLPALATAPGQPLQSNSVLFRVACIDLRRDDCLGAGSSNARAASRRRRARFRFLARQRPGDMLTHQG